MTATEALLGAEVNPNGEATGYHFEHVDDATFQADIAAAGAGHGFDHAVKAPDPDASVGSGAAAIPVSQPIAGLSPATTYHFRLVATNPLGAAAGPGKTFATYPAPIAGLPDGRAYELVTPPDTNGRPPTAAPLGAPIEGFATSLAAPSGDSVVFETVGGALPGMNGNGVSDRYRAVRGGGGWESRIASPSGAQSEVPNPGGVSPDHRYSFWSTGGEGGGTPDGGSLVLGPITHYIRNPDGSFELIGRGSLGDDPTATGRWITPGGGHVIFVTGVGNPSEVETVQLEPNAPPTGIKAIYDRTPGGATHVVSLLPGDVTPEADASYLGASADGSAVAFRVEGTIYERRGNASTLEVIGGEATFAGVSQNGDRVFYLKGEDIFAFDADSRATTQITSSGDATVVNVSADGSHVYFVSTSQLDGAKGAAGADNLYVFDGAATRFIAVLDHLDVTGEDIGGGVIVGGLGLWTSHAVAPVQGQTSGPGNDPSRTTPDGAVLVFESHANLTGYDSEGHSEVYRYDAGEESLRCVSCNPSLAAAASDAQLQSIDTTDPFVPTNSLSRIANLTDDGEAVFFQTADALVPGDMDGTQDVYQWKDGGLSLISSGHSATPDYLYAMTPDGHDVFFTTTEALVPQAGDGGVPAIYDARIGGGFPVAPAPLPCQGDACQGNPSASPPPLEAASAALEGSGNVKPPRHRCASFAKRAKRLGARAKRLRRNAARVISNPTRARRLRHRAHRLTRQAKRLSAQAKACKRHSGRAAR